MRGLPEMIANVLIHTIEWHSIGGGWGNLGGVVTQLVMSSALFLLLKEPCAGVRQLSGAIVIIFFFSLFVQAAEGSTYGIFHYVDPPALDPLRVLSERMAIRAPLLSVWDSVSLDTRMPSPFWAVPSWGVPV